MAALAVSRSRPFADLRGSAVADERMSDPCLAIGNIGANRVPYRRLGHEMRRFTALALDNIRHDPAGYVWASAHRALRMFLIEGSGDTRTAYQFNRAALIYAVAHVVSLVYLVLFIAGVTIAAARRLVPLSLLMPIVFVPLTICFMLINARYSMTTQPFMFAFVAMALVSGADAWQARRPPRLLRAPASPAAERQ
jgi:hypothetical protein